MLALAIAVAALAGLVLGASYHLTAPKVPAWPGPSTPDRPLPVVLLVELVRSVVMAVVVTFLLVSGGVAGLIEGALLGLALWVIAAALIAGSVFQGRASLRGAALDSADWLVRLVATGAIVGGLIEYFLSGP